MSLKQFYSDRYMHIRAFAVYFVISAIACAALYAIRDASFYEFNFAWWQPLVYIPLGIYVGGLSAVFIHNATHGSFPNKWLNEAAGYFAGVHQLWGFTGWKLIHLLHHHYSDRDGFDPHPPKGMTFKRFLLKMFLGSSASVSQRYREHWGLTSQTKVMHATVWFLSVGMGIFHLLFWFLLLGPEAFVFFYLTSFVVNHLVFANINYHAHPLDAETDVTKATNLNHNLYYKLANFFWFGIYYHGNHHRKPLLFNPRKMQERTPRAARGFDAASVSTRNTAPNRP